MPLRRIFFLGLLAVMPAIAQPSAGIEYARDIAPILRSYCAGCHSDAQHEGGLSVETHARFRKGGEDHGDPFDSAKSGEAFLLQSIEGRVRPKMPPKDEPQLPPGDLATLRRWITSGAPGPERDVSIFHDLVTPRLKGATGPKPYSAAAYSPDGTRLALTRTGSLEVWDTVHQALVRTISGLPGKVNAVHFSPDGGCVVVATGVTGLRGVALWYTTESGTLVREFGGHADVLYDAEISPDGTLLATAGYDRVLKIWRIADGALLRTMDVHKGAVFDLAWHPSGKVLASASADETVKLWRVSDGVRLDTLNQAQGELMSVVFTPDGGHILASGTDKRIHLWKFVTLDSPGLNPVVHSRFAHESAIHRMALSADGRQVLSSANDRSLKVWSVPELELLETLPPQTDIAAAVVAVPKSERFLLARMDGTTATVSAAVKRQEPQPAAPTGQSLATGGTEVAEIRKIAESEPNDRFEAANPVGNFAEITGTIGRDGDSDLFRFHARSGVPVLLEVNAARSKSKLDSRIEVLHPDGRPVEQVVLQATRDSWFTFRGKDSDTADDFRLHNWAEMELNEYVYASGEVVKLWLYPRGPDSGFKVYPGEGKRENAFFTTSLTHALGEPCYVVAPFPPGSEPAPNGLPVFRLHYVNDDDSSRQRGADSMLIFSAPTDGDYLARVTDVRNFGGGRDFHYSLSIRPPRPDFKVTMSGLGPKVSPGSGREITFKVERYEGFEGPVRIDIDGLPPGFQASTPIEIEAGQPGAVGVVMAAADAADPDDAADKAVTVTAKATVDGKAVSHPLGDLGNLQVGPPAKVLVEILPSNDRSFVKETPGQPLEFSLRPGQTLTARVRAVRKDFTGRIEMGNEDSGRNLPHGLYVDNIGLNGLLIVEGQTEREFFVTASRIVRPGARMFHLRTRADDGQASRPAVIRVLPAEKFAAAP